MYVCMYVLTCCVVYIDICNICTCTCIHAMSAKLKKNGKFNEYQRNYRDNRGIVPMTIDINRNLRVQVNFPTGSYY